MNIAAARAKDAGWEPCGVTRQRQAPIQNSLGATEVQIALQLYATPTLKRLSLLPPSLGKLASITRSSSRK